MTRTKLMSLALVLVLSACSSACGSEREVFVEELSRPIYIEPLSPHEVRSADGMVRFAGSDGEVSIATEALAGELRFVTEVEKGQGRLGSSLDDVRVTPEEWEGPHGTTLKVHSSYRPVVLTVRAWLTIEGAEGPVVARSFCLKD